MRSIQKQLTAKGSAAVQIFSINPHNFQDHVFIITDPVCQIKLGSQLSQKKENGYLSHLCLSLPRPHRSEWKG